MPPGGQSPHPAASPCPAGLSPPSTEPVAPSTPRSHPAAGFLPAPRGLASLAEGGAAAGGSRCHLHLAALGTGGASSTALPRGPGDPAKAEGWQKAGERLATPGNALWEKPRQGTAARTRMDAGSAVPGTTPLVAMALMEMAVSIVCREKHGVSTRQSWTEGQGRGRESWGRAGTWGSLGPR